MNNRYQILELGTFSVWLKNQNSEIKTRINRRLERMANGNLGDFKSVGEKVFEIRFHFGAGYRVYFSFNGEEIILLLLGGDKSSQEEDIKKAIQLLEKYNEQK